MKPFPIMKYWHSLSKEMQDYISGLCLEIVKLNYEVIDQKKRADDLGEERDRLAGRLLDAAEYICEAKASADGLQKKWEVAVDMAARAENERDALIAENSRLHGWLNEAWQKKPREWMWVDFKKVKPPRMGWYITCDDVRDVDSFYWDGERWPNYSGNPIRFWMKYPDAP